MIDSLDDLYDQIIQCERRIEEKQRLQSELRSEVQSGTAALQCLHQHHSRQQQELLEKEDRSCGVELEERNMGTREAVLLSQRDCLRQQHSKLEREQASVDHETEEEMVTFCQSVEARAEDLDLSTSGQRARQHRATSTLEHLLETEKMLIQETAEYEMHRERLFLLETDQHCHQQALLETARTNKEVEECMVKEEERLQQLEEERLHVANIPHCGQEFNRLRGELASLHTGPMEQDCSLLQQQVSVLQQQQHGRLQHHQRHEQLRQSPQPPPSPALEIGSQGVDDMGEGHPGTADVDDTAQATVDLVSTTEDDVIGDDDDGMMLPDLDMTEAKPHDTGNEGFRVCNRQKPVFKPLHC